VTKQAEIPVWETLLAHAALLHTKIPAANISAHCAVPTALV